MVNTLLFGGYDRTRQAFDAYKAARAEASLTAPGEDRFSYMAFCYVGDTDEEGIRIGQKIAWFLTVSIKSSPQFSKFQPGAVVPEMAPAAWRTGASRATASDQSRRRRARRPGPDVRGKSRHGRAADQGLPQASRRHLPRHHDDPPGPGDACGSGTQLLARGAGCAAAAARPAAGRRRRDRMAGAARGGGKMSGASKRLSVGPFELEVLRRKAKRPGTPTLLLVHGINAIDGGAPFLDLLAEYGEIVAPSHPGFGASPRSADFDTMYDLVHLYLGVLDALPAERVTMVGFSFGGWIAAEIAAAGHRKLDRLVLVDPVGVKLGGREERDIAHLFNTLPAELNRRAWHDPAKCPPGSYGVGFGIAGSATAMSDEAMVTLARNWDSLCLYAWRPHLYNPQLKQWLHRIAVPTLVLWGESDRVVTPAYGRAYAGLIPGARFEARSKRPDTIRNSNSRTRSSNGSRRFSTDRGRRHDVHRPRLAAGLPPRADRQGRTTDAGNRAERARQDRLFLRRRGRRDRRAPRRRPRNRRAARWLVRRRQRRRGGHLRPR